MFKLKEHLTNSIFFPCSSQKQDRYSDKNVFEIDQVIILRIALMDSQPVKLFKTKKKSNTFWLLVVCNIFARFHSFLHYNRNYILYRNTLAFNYLRT